MSHMLFIGGNNQPQILYVNNCFLKVKCKYDYEPEHRKSNNRLVRKDF